MSTLARRLKLMAPLLATLTAGAVQATADVSYVVVVSAETSQSDAWSEVVDALVEKHDAEVISYEDDVSSCLDALAAVHPRYAAFVARPEEAGRRFVRDVHVLTRALDDDPYTDVRWGIVTGYEASDALRIARAEGPLVMRVGAAGTGLDLSKFEQGAWYDEGRAGHAVIKTVDGVREINDGPADSIAALVALFNDLGTQFFLTSGHATERDWRPGYSYRNGQFRCENGRLYGLDLAGKRHPIDAPDPTVYLAAGNCLMGHIKDRESMALAFMHSAGVNQLVGYTVVTWFGRGGWGVKDYLFSEPGRYSVSDAFFFNLQLILDDIEQRYDALADRPTPGLLDNNHQAVIRAARRAGIEGNRVREAAGLWWDRDAVAFCGDPAYEARLAPQSSAWRETLTTEGNETILRIEALRDVQPGRPIAIFLPERIGAVRVHRGEEYGPLITDDFIILRYLRRLEAGKTYELAFATEPAEQARQSTGETTVSWNEIQSALQLLPPDYLPDVVKAMSIAEGNASELVKAIHDTPESQRESLAFLLAHMPERDLVSIDADLLVTNIAYAHRTREEAPWGASIPDDVFRNYVLPYANVNERRDDWRADFHDRFAAVAYEAGTIEDAVLALNKHVFESLNVRYHATKREKPDQSPYETMASGYASCTGLSILLADALRAAGIPCRVAGVPQWHNDSGNHTWVEVWDDGTWHHIGAAEPGPYDQTWFNAIASKAVADEREYAVYAVSYEPTGVLFPLVWDQSIDYVHAVNVTDRYTARKSGTSEAD
jgi:hypothetical protein